jgi:transcriptional regulator with XRE-family HTH domain
VTLGAGSVASSGGSIEAVRRYKGVVLPPRSAAGPLKDMAKAFKNLIAKMPEEAQARVKVRSREILLEMNLQELRQTFTRLTQEDMAQLLDVTQAYISKAERRDGDMLLSTLYQLVGAMGGTVELRVQLPGQAEVRLNQFDETAKLALIRDRASEQEPKSLPPASRPPASR